MVRVRFLMLGLLVLLAGCSVERVFEVTDASDASVGADVPDCPITCIGAGGATFRLACGPSDLTSVALSGPCATGDANPANYIWGHDDELLEFSSPSPGVCHVELTFATGFTYSTDITFATMADPTLPGCPPCPPYVAPTQGVFDVGNPDTTCTDAGVADAADEG